MQKKRHHCNCKNGQNVIQSWFASEFWTFRSCEAGFYTVADGFPGGSVVDSQPQTLQIYAK